MEQCENHIHGLEPLYRHLTQKENFCFPTSLQMVLFRRGDFYDLEQLAKYLGVKVAKKHEHIYTEEFEVLPSRDPRVGFLFSNLTDNEILEKIEKLGLKPQIYYPSKLPSVEKFIIENLDANNDVMMNFHWLEFKPKKGKNMGHYVLISKYDGKSKMLTVCDASFKRASYWERPLKRFENAMSPEYDGRERGFVVFNYDASRKKIKLPKIITPKQLEKIVVVHDIPSFD